MPPERHLSEDRLASPLKRLLLWGGAVGLSALVLYVHVELRPTRPYEGTVEFAGKSQSYQLPREAQLFGPYRPDQLDPGTLIDLRFNGPMPPLDAAVLWRPYPSDEPLAATPFQETRERVIRPGEQPEQWMTLVADIAPQPPGDRIAYAVSLTSEDKEIRLPSGEENVVLRQIGFVRQELEYPFQIAMLLMLVLGIRAGLTALFDAEQLRRYAWVTFILATVGGMTLRPFVQKAAYGAYWNGVPIGDELSDTWMLTIWIVWLVACLSLGGTRKQVSSTSRALVVCAAGILCALYPLPYKIPELFQEMLQT